MSTDRHYEYKRGGYINIDRIYPPVIEIGECDAYHLIYKSPEGVVLGNRVFASLKDAQKERRAYMDFVNSNEPTKIGVYTRTLTDEEKEGLRSAMKGLM